VFYCFEESKYFTQINPYSDEKNILLGGSGREVFKEIKENGEGDPLKD